MLAMIHSLKNRPGHKKEMNHLPTLDFQGLRTAVPPNAATYRYPLVQFNEHHFLLGRGILELLKLSEISNLIPQNHGGLRVSSTSQQSISFSFAGRRGFSEACPHPGGQTTLPRVGYIWGLFEKGHPHFLRSSPLFYIDIWGDIFIIGHSNSLIKRCR